MAFAEDLTPFFNTDEHAVSATFKAPGGVTVIRTANVILSTPAQGMQVGQSGEVVQLQPSLLCPTAHLAGVKKNCVVGIGTDSYHVVNREDDGTGVSTVWLRRG